MIQSDKYYKLSEAIKLHPIFERRTVRWFYDLVDRGRLSVVNTSNTDTPRYLIQGKELLRFINQIDKPTVLNK